MLAVDQQEEKNIVFISDLIETAADMKTDHFSLFQLRTAWEFFDRCDQAAKSGYVIRVIRTMTYMLFLIHVETCGYYAISEYEGIGSNHWVYNGEGNA